MIQERIFIIIIACLLDLVFGDPHWLWHPVQGMGWLIDHVEAWMRKRFRIREDRDADIRKKQVTGTFTVVIVITVSLLVAAGILYGWQPDSSYVVSGCGNLDVIPDAGSLLASSGEYEGVQGT